MSMGRESHRRGLALAEAQGEVRLASLFALSGAEQPPWGEHGWLAISTQAGPIAADDLRLTRSDSDAPALYLKGTTPAGLCVASQWSCDEATGLWIRRDRLENRGDAPVELRRCLSRVVLAGGQYEYYSQSGRWCRESQGTWRALPPGRTVLACEGGRTCQGNTPLLGLRRTDAPGGLALHVLPVGNWVIRLTHHTAMDRQPILTLDVGLGDENLRLTLAPGERVDLPAILYQPLTEGRIESVAPAIGRQRLDASAPPNHPTLPVVYNTWFDRFDEIEPQRLNRQLAAAAEVGCEVFVVDAGWYGRGEGSWANQCGDWREKLDGAFEGRMAEFADEIRRTGLGFGLWVEPERLCENVPALTEHPHRYLRSSSGRYYPDLAKEEPRRATLDELARLVETYELAWMKIDFNHAIGPDPAGEELHGYARAWQGMLAELRRRFPQTIFEGCASGGMRLDAETLRHVDLHFLSDTVEPVDVLRIGQGSLLRLPPGRLGRWAVVRPDECATPEDNTVLVPGGATWDQARRMDLSFVARVALCGAFGLSGDLAALPGRQRAALARHVAWYHQHRSLIAAAHAYLLTPPKGLADRTGWAAIQLTAEPSRPTLLFAYRLGETWPGFRLYPQGLAPDTHYRLTDMDGNETHPAKPGSAWTTEGVEVRLDQPFTAAVLTLTPC
jgi:alpha-galactosidase